MNTRHDLTIAYTDDYQRWQLGEGHPTDPVRALIATRLLRSTTTARGLSLLELTGIETPRVRVTRTFTDYRRFLTAGRIVQ